ncbi:MAG: sugar kinase [Clostridia bacterium]|nr:sugar kinase [Clostridia bacterium]
MFDFKEDAKYDIIGMGEVMLRLSPPDKETVSRSDIFVKTAGGSELNVVSGVAMLGARGGIITKLPDSKIGRFIRNRIRYGNVSDDYVLFDKSQSKRLGIYYYESGAYPRKSSVLYDRAFSSMSSLKLNEIPESVFLQTRIFHVSSITMALGSKLRETVTETVKKFRNSGTKISFDVNYRAALWTEEQAREAVEAILPFVDFLFVSEETSRRMLKRTGSLDSIMKGFEYDYGCELVATTQREAISPTRHNFSSVILSGGRFYKEKPYDNIEVIDRVGSGDAYVAGVLYGLLESGLPERGLRIGNALSALKNTVVGDMSVFSLDETEKVIEAHSSESVQSEMDR